MGINLEDYLGKILPSNVAPFFNPSHRGKDIKTWLESNGITVMSYGMEIKLGFAMTDNCIKVDSRGFVCRYTIGNYT